jgi:hypothetical protein
MIVTLERQKHMVVVVSAHSVRGRLQLPQGSL